MGNPQELLETAHRLWYSEKDALRAQQILNGIIEDYPDSPEAEKAKSFLSVIYRSPAFHESDAVEGRGCREAVFRTLAGILGISTLVVLALGGVDTEPAWRAVTQGLLFVVLALVFLGFAISGTAGGNWLSDWIGVWVFFRATTGWRRYLTDGLFIAFNVLAIGLFVLSPFIFEYHCEIEESYALRLEPLSLLDQRLIASFHGISIGVWPLGRCQPRFLLR